VDPLDKLGRYVRHGSAVDALAEGNLEQDILAPNAATVDVVGIQEEDAGDIETGLVEDGAPLAAALCVRAPLPRAGFERR